MLLIIHESYGGATATSTIVALARILRLCFPLSLGSFVYLWIQTTPYLVVSDVHFI